MEETNKRNKGKLPQRMPGFAEPVPNPKGRARPIIAGSNDAVVRF